MRVLIKNCIGTERTSDTSINANYGRLLHGKTLNYGESEHMLNKLLSERLIAKKYLFFLFTYFLSTRSIKKRYYIPNKQKNMTISNYVFPVDSKRARL